MTKTYFTFGSDCHFPYGQYDYVEIEAENMYQACKLFQTIHPNRHNSDLLNCAFVYTEEWFNKIRNLYYQGVEPIEKITVRRRGNE